MFARVLHVGTKARLARVTRMARDLANSHTLCESVNVTVKTTINFYDTANLSYIVIKKTFE